MLRTIAWGLALSSLTLGPKAQADDGSPGEYRLQAADQVVLSLPLNPELNASGPIGPDGRFSMPLVGRLEFAGRTLTEAEHLVADALRRDGIVADAHPNLAVSAYGSAVYVGGEVRTPGAVPLNKALDPLQAVIASGGLLDTARSGKVAVISRPANGPAMLRIVDLKSYATRGGRPPLTLAPGDVVFVPKSRVAELDLWLDQHVNKVVPQALHFNYNLGETTSAATAIVSP